MNNIQVYSVGSQVTIGGCIPATIVSLEILGIGAITPLVRYQVAWWDGANRNTQWLYSYEITPSSDMTQIGFIPR